jgi:solute:Na+ symporter, SSS family
VLASSFSLGGKQLPAIADWSFLDRMSLTFLFVMLVLAAMRLLRPLPQPVDLPVNEKMNLDSSPIAKFFAAVVVLMTIGLYLVFW